VVIRIAVGLRSIPAFLGYQIVAALLLSWGMRGWQIGSYFLTPRSAILWIFAISFPALAILRAFYIARTGHIPRRQDLVRDE